MAEASARGWISANTESLYLSGIKANFDYYAQYAKGSANYFTADKYTSYIEQQTVAFKEGDINSEIEQILTQKYITMFHQGGWTIYFDQLRTGYPVLVQQPGITPPTRWTYPNSEYNRNQKNLQDAIARQFAEGDNIRGITWWLK